MKYDNSKQFWSARTKPGQSAKVKNWKKGPKGSAVYKRSERSQPSDVKTLTVEEYKAIRLQEQLADL